MKTIVTDKGARMDRVVEAVVRKQGDMNDSQLSRKLGISNVMWNYLKTGQRNPGKKFYSAVMREYPDLIPVVLMAMTEGDR